VVEGGRERWKGGGRGLVAREERVVEKVEGGGEGQEKRKRVADDGAVWSE